MAAEPLRVAVFRALQLGDMLCAVPALRALRRRFPGAHLTLIGLPWAAAFASRFPCYVDAFLPFPGYPGLPEQPPEEAAFGRLVDQARERRFDLAIQMHGDGRLTNAIVRRLGALAVAGFCCGESGAGEAFLPYPQRGSEIHRLLSLASFLGAPPHGEHLEFPLGQEDEAELAGFAAQRGLPAGPCVCLHPGARAAEKRWPPQNFAAVGDALYEQYGLPVVITGSQAERPLAAAIARAMRAPAADAAGPISVGGLAAQLARARLLVSNDTGVSHIAAALRVPSVVVFISTDVERWAPLDRALHRAVWDPACRLTDEVLARSRPLLESLATAPAQAPSLLSR